MYTLRTFKDKSKTDRIQIYLGDSYQVVGAYEEDIKNGIKLRVYGNYDSHVKEGIAIYEDHYAFIMTQLGGTFETLNRPSIKLINKITTTETTICYLKKLHKIINSSESIEHDKDESIVLFEYIQNLKE